MNCHLYSLFLCLLLCFLPFGIPLLLFVFHLWCKCTWNLQTHKFSAHFEIYKITEHEIRAPSLVHRYAYPRVCTRSCVSVFFFFFKSFQAIEDFLCFTKPRLNTLGGLGEFSKVMQTRDAVERVCITVSNSPNTLVFRSSYVKSPLLFKYLSFFDASHSNHTWTSAYTL